MDSDLLLVVGVILSAVSIPSIVGALADGRAPRMALVTVLVGGTCIVVAIRGNSYTISEIPDAFVRVIGRYL